MSDEIISSRNGSHQDVQANDDVVDNPQHGQDQPDQDLTPLLVLDGEVELK